MDELFVDPNQVVRDAIFSALKPHARLAASGWAFYPDPSFDDLDAQQRMLVVLLGKKASRLAGKVETDRVSRDELCSLASVGEGTYRPYAPRMERAGLIRREGEDLWIPDEGVVRAANVVLGRLVLPKENGSRSSPTKPEETEVEEPTLEDATGNGAQIHEDTTISMAPASPARNRRPRKTRAPRRARSAKDFGVLYSGKIDLSEFPHPEDLSDSIKIALLPLLVAREGYNLEGLPLKEMVEFLRQKYGREVAEGDMEATLNSLKGRYVDSRFDSHMNRNIYCLLDQGRALFGDRNQSVTSSTEGLGAVESE